MYKEVVEYFQMDRTESISSSDYVVLRTPLWCSFTKELIEHKHYDNMERWKTSWTVTALWTMLSILVTLTCTIGFVETEWFVRENNTLSSNELSILTYDRSSLVYTLGMFNVCYRDLHQTDFHCHRFGVTRFPSSSWQGTCVLYGAGCVLQGCGAVVLILSLMSRVTARRIGAHLVSHVYVIAGFLQTISLLLYPLILDTHVGKLHCGSNAHAYGPDLCRVGWAYVASTAGTLLTFYCPFLAYFSFYRVYDDQPVRYDIRADHMNPNFLL
ncbi:LHFPL tetraspan subfamily member 2a protein-like [Argiope bruennichi]|uniref:LHFPL tetraspan subfamily member 2a protein like n=1 Tax=Argiope bruennichi TaxID=94029 RepID=A0A8T0E8P9_ARGBR|nr:LHFPL tetraspan subfamily member 2a protein-like [Argiope bruennichi]KAF8767706.1 LHFPL tetraspan subfamily member 2a protein like [Argiope bruennichi]